MTIDEHPVQQDIQQVTTNGDEHRNGRVAESFQKLFAERKQQKWHDGEHDEDVIGPCAGTTSGSCPNASRKPIHGANSANDRMLIKTVNTRPFVRYDVICSCLCAISSSVVPSFSNFSNRPWTCPTSGVMPMSAPIANTITVKNSALEKLTAAKSVVP